MSKRKPKAWPELWLDGGCYSTVRGKRRNIVVQTKGDDRVVAEVREPEDACLIIAAPELLEALEDLEVVTRPSGNVTDDEVERLEVRHDLEDGTWSQVVQAVHDTARIVIAKARGEL